MQDQDIISEDERHEAASETPAFLGCPQHMPTHLPGGFDGVEPGEKSKSEVEVEQRNFEKSTVWLRASTSDPSRLDDIGMQMDRMTVVDDDGVVCKIRRAGVLMMGIGRPAQLWEVDATKHPTYCRVMVYCDHRPIFDGKAFGKNIHRAGLLGLAVMIRFIQAQRKHQRHCRKAAVKKLIKEELA